ncbi:MAG: ATP-binding protein [Planctomycetota bacterium]|nr:ATP-binding protein [Planctomycetota bacterium]
MAHAEPEVTLTPVELQVGFDAFIAASKQLEQGYAELKARAAAVDLELQVTNRQLQMALAERDAIFAALPMGVLARRCDGSVAFANDEGERLAVLIQQGGIDLKKATAGDHAFGGAAVRIAKAALPDGELLLLEDRSRMHALESEVRRLDRLAGFSELALGIAHEIKNPLNGAMGFAALLERTPEGPGVARHARSVRDGLQRVDEIVRSLLAFARPEQRRLQTARIVTIVNDAASAAGLPLGRAVIEVGGELRAESDVLLRVLAVLFRNAREAGGDSVRIRVAAQVAEANLEVTIEDDGPGVPTELGDKVFEPFVSSKARGTGLGLPLAARVLAFLGGDVALQNPGQPGAKFRIRMPVARMIVQVREACA